MQSKLIGISALVFGALNSLIVFWESEWYLILCVLALGLPPLLAGMAYIVSKTDTYIRALSWVNIIFGFSILSLAASSFYGRTAVPLVQYIAAAGLMLSGCYGLYIVTRKMKMTIIP